MVTEMKAWKHHKRKHVEGIYWALVFIWAGLVFGSDSLGVLPRVGSATAWSWVFAGAGSLSLLGSIIRAYSPDWPNPTTWDYIWATILLSVGLGGFLNVDIAFPIVLIVVGITFLGNLLLDRE
jgi:hypothetical protein